jgi:hypothetical protein
MSPTIFELLYWQGRRQVKRWRFKSPDEVKKQADQYNARIQGEASILSASEADEMKIPIPISAGREGLDCFAMLYPASCHWGARPVLSHQNEDPRFGSLVEIHLLHLETKVL